MKQRIELSCANPSCTSTLSCDRRLRKQVPGLYTFATKPLMLSNMYMAEIAHSLHTNAAGMAVPLHFEYLFWILFS